MTLAQLIKTSGVLMQYGEINESYIGPTNTSQTAEKPEPPYFPFSPPAAFVSGVRDPVLAGRDLA